ncbi:MAG TPA: hypothetical protein VMW24_24970 [Sedimentisphaerales bacterium]|nr:hypothetical protein [Sedimentisphaerales bacterium]
MAVYRSMEEYYERFFPNEREERRRKERLKKEDPLAYAIEHVWEVWRRLHWKTRPPGEE